MAWNIKFCQTFAAKCQLASAEEPAPKVQQSTTCSIKKIAFKVKDIRKLLRNLQPDNATGLDEIPARVLKECSAELARPLSLLFELCFSKGVFQANGSRHLSSLFIREIRNLIHLCTAHLSALHHQQDYGGCCTEPTSEVPPSKPTDLTVWI